MPPIPNKVSDEKRQPDKIVEDVYPHGAKMQHTRDHRPQPADRTERFAEEADHHHLRIAAQILCHYPIAIPEEPDAHGHSAHDKGVVKPWQSEEIEHQVWIEDHGCAPGDVIKRGDAEDAAKRSFAHCSVIRSFAPAPSRKGTRSE